MAFRGPGARSFSSAPAGRFSASPGFSGPRIANRAPAFRGAGPSRFPGRWNHGNGGHRRRPYISLYGTGVPYLVAPWAWDLGDPGYFDDSGDSNDQPVAPTGPDYAPPNAYAPEGPGAYDAPPPDPYQPAPPRPAYQPPAEPAPAPLSQDAVTLVFKDGRPDEQIHNYILTRNALYVQDQNRRTIPLEQLDLTATTKVNRQAGVDFEIPNRPR